MRMLKKNIPATHHDIVTPDIARQWEHLKGIADKIYHQPQIGISMLIGRNIPTAFQPLEVICGEADKPWAEKYKFGWMIIRPVCLDKIALHEPTSEASVNRVTVTREELPESPGRHCDPFRRQNVNEGHDVLLKDS